MKTIRQTVYPAGAVVLVLGSGGEITFELEDAIVVTKGCITICVVAPSEGDLELHVSTDSLETPEGLFHARTVVIESADREFRVCDAHLTPFAIVDAPSAKMSVSILRDHICDPTRLAILMESEGEEGPLELARP